jgi:hypothetical protein
MTSPLRQGDVILVPVTSIPKIAKKIARGNGCVVLAYGEVTGHAHAIHDKNATILAEPNGAQYLRVIAGDGVAIRPVAELEPVGLNAIRIQDASGLIIRMPLADAAEVRAALASGSTLTRPGSLVQHEEHDAIMIEPGLYALPGQREYTSADMAPVRVAD